MSFNPLSTDMAGRTQGRVAQAIATASRRTGVDFSYLLGQAQIESAMNPSARASTSSATGLYQFLDQSWLAVVNNHGADYGMSWAADAIQKTSSGRYYVADPQLREQILDLRNHPETASAMAAELASDNRDYLEQHIGRTPEAADLYLAHFLGAGGAAKFLNAMQANPNMSAASLFPAAARTNESVFYDRDGNARSLADIRASFASRIANGVQNAETGTANVGDTSGWSLPPGAKVVAPADYLRIAQALADPTAQNAQRVSTVVDPLGIAAQQSGDDISGAATSQDPLAQLQALTLAQPYNAAQPRNEAARLAYLMLATLGR